MLAGLRAEGVGPSRVSMFVRGAAVFSPDEVRALENDGATIRTNAGVVMTIDVPLDSVERVLDHEFVIASELSSPLYPERRDEE
jgi:hypothetical protein